MKKLYLSILIILSFNLYSQRDYTHPDIKKYLSEQKSFAVIPFDFKVTSEKPRKMDQNDFEKSVIDAEINGATAAQESIINRILKKKKRAPIDPISQAKTNTLLKRDSNINFKDGAFNDLDYYLPEELCELLGVDAIIMGSVNSEKIFTTAGSIALRLLKIGGAPKVSADISLFHKDGTLIWNWASKYMKASGMGSSIEDMMDYIFKKGARKLPYTGADGMR